METLLTLGDLSVFYQELVLLQDPMPPVQLLIALVAELVDLLVAYLVGDHYKIVMLLVQFHLLLIMPLIQSVALQVMLRTVPFRIVSLPVMFQQAVQRLALVGSL